MKYSNKPCHFAPRKKVLNSKNISGHKSLGGVYRKRNLPTPADIVRMFYGSLSRRTRAAYIAKQKADNKT